MSKTEDRIPLRRAIGALERQQIVTLVEARGAAAAAALVGVHTQTLASLAAGFAAHRSTVGLVERRLAELAAEGGK